jgi:hypothetical protein
MKGKEVKINTTPDSHIYILNFIADEYKQKASIATI